MIFGEYEVYEYINLRNYQKLDYSCELKFQRFGYELQRIDKAINDYNLLQRPYPLRKGQDRISNQVNHTNNE